MLICHCHRVDEATIRSCARSGADTVEAVALACGAGACCGGCGPLVAELIAEETEHLVHLGRRSPSLSAPRCATLDK